MGFEDMWNSENWNEVMENEDWVYEEDKYTATFEDLREKLDSTIENIRQMTFDKMKGRVEDGASKIAEKVKKTDTANIVKKIVEDIMPKIEDIQKLIEDLEVIQEEINSRNIENPEMEMMEKEIKELEGWKAYGQEIKQTIADIAIDIGKISLIGVGKIGKNIIGGTIIGAFKLGKNMKKFTSGKKFKIKDAESKSKIQEKRDNAKSKRKKHIRTVGKTVQYDETDVEGIFSQNFEGDEEFENFAEYDDEELKKINEYENIEEYYNDNELNKDENFAQRTIRGIKEFCKEKSTKFTWIKDKESRKEFINKQKEKIETAIKSSDTYYNAGRIVADIKYNYKETKSKAIAGAKNIHEKAVDRYEETKKKFELNKTSALKMVLENGANFAKKMLSAIEPQLQSQTEKQEQLKKEVELKADKRTKANMNNDTLKR